MELPEHSSAAIPRNSSAPSPTSASTTPVPLMLGQACHYCQRFAWQLLAVEPIQDQGPLSVLSIAQ